MFRAIVHFVVLCVVLCVVPPVPAHGADVTLSAAREGDAVDITASATLSVDRDSAWRVLTAYDRYATFIPDMESSRIVSRDGDHVVVEQRGAARWLWLSQPVTIRMAVTETPPVLVLSRLLSGTIRDMRGRYELVRESDRLRLVYTGRIVPDDTQVGYFDLLAVRANASRQFTALVHEIERVGRRIPDEESRR